MVESIISSHEKVSSIGEINFVSNFVKSNFFKDNKIILDDLDKFSGLSLRKEYFNYLESFNINKDLLNNQQVFLLPLPDALLMFSHLGSFDQTIYFGFLG